MAGEFYEDSIDDTLNAQAAILDFIKHAITLTTSECELGSRATTGLYYILRSAIDNVENCALMLHAYRGGAPYKAITTVYRRVANRSAYFLPDSKKPWGDENDGTSAAANCEFLAIGAASKRPYTVHRLVAHHVGLWPTSCRRKREVNAGFATRTR